MSVSYMALAMNVCHEGQSQYTDWLYSKVWLTSVLTVMGGTRHTGSIRENVVSGNKSQHAGAQRLMFLSVL